MANDVTKMLEGFMDSPKWQAFLDKLTKDFQKERDLLQKEPTDDIYVAETTVWRKTRDYVNDKVIPFFKEIVGEIPGSKEVLALIEENQKNRIQNIEIGILEDKNKNYSSHDIIRAKLGYIRKLPEYPVALINEQEAMESNSEARAVIGEEASDELLAQD